MIDWSALLGDRTNGPVAYAIAILGSILVAVLLIPLRDFLNTASVGLLLLMTTLALATRLGPGPLLAGAVASAACFDLLFLPPFGRFVIADPSNYIALAVFSAVAVTVGQLSARLRVRAQQAERDRQHIGWLYQQVRESFDRDSENEALRRSEKLKSALLDAVTHDLRTPLTSIKASATALLEAEARTSRASPVAATRPDPPLADASTLDAPGFDAGARRELLEVIDEEADRLNRFIESLVELARIEAGEIDVERTWIAIEDIVHGALDRARGLLTRHRVDVTLAPDLPSIRADARAMTEVVYVLVDNAAKYSPAGTTIRVAAAVGDEGAVDLSVEDEGPGVPVPLREKVFARFYRVSPTEALDRATGRAASLGMGLAIARGLVDAHGGRIWIEDGQHDRGARVVCRIPIGDD